MLDLIQYSNIPQQTYYQFPWLNGSSEVLFDYFNLSAREGEAVSVVEMVTLLFAELPELETRILQILQNAAESKEIISTPTDDITNLAMYPVLQIIMSLAGNRIIGNAISNIYAKHCQKELKMKAAMTHRSGDKYTDQNLQTICENMGIKCQVRTRNIIDNVNYPFQMEFTSFLKVSTKLTGEEWKLINRIFTDGVINLIRDDVIMLLREMVRNKTKPDYKAISPELGESLMQVGPIARIKSEIEKLIEVHSKRFDSSTVLDGEKVEYELFPPCMKAILYRAGQGENLSHNERLAIAFFFLNTNHTIEETVDIFRTIPDFDEGIARYQVEFAAGKGGKGKKYKMYNCGKLKSFRLCKADDPKFGDRLCVKGGKRRDGTYQPINSPIHDYLFWKRVQQRHEARVQSSTDPPSDEQEGPVGKEEPQKSGEGGQQ